MGIGSGYIAKGLNSEADNLRRQKRDDERLGMEKNRETREQTDFDNRQEDRDTYDKPMKGYGLKKAQRDDELGALEAEIKKNDMEALKKVQGARDQATQMKVSQEVAELEAKNAGLIYKAYKLRGGKAAARLLNQMRGSEVNNAADFVEYVDPKTKKKMIKVVDAEGNVVTEDGEPMVMDADELEKVFGVKAEKGSFNESERGVLDTRTGKFKPHGPGVPRKQNTEHLNYMRQLTNDGTAIILKKYGGTLDPMGNIMSFAEGQEQKALDALEIGADLVAEGYSPQRAANLAIEAAEKGVKPKSKRGPGMNPKTPGGAPQSPPKDPDSYFKALRDLPENKDVSDAELQAHVAKKFPNWRTPGINPNP